MPARAAERFTTPAGTDPPPRDAVGGRGGRGIGQLRDAAGAGAEARRVGADRRGVAALADLAVAPDDLARAAPLEVDDAAQHDVAGLRRREREAPAGLDAAAGAHADLLPARVGVAADRQPAP